MEDIKKLTIQEVKIKKSGFKKDGVTPYTLYSVKTDDGYYSTFDLALSPGETATFKVTVEPGDMNPKTGQPYINKTILGYTGSIENMPAKPFRTSNEARPLGNTLTPLGAELQELERAYLDLKGRMDSLESRIEVLERPAFDDINPKANPDNLPTF